MAALTDDADYDAGETSENVPSPLSGAGNHDNYYGKRFWTICVLPSRPDNKTNLSALTWTQKPVMSELEHFPPASPLIRLYLSSLRYASPLTSLLITWSLNAVNRPPLFLTTMQPILAQPHLNLSPLALWPCATSATDGGAELSEDRTTEIDASEEEVDEDEDDASFRPLSLVAKPESWGQAGPAESLSFPVELGSSCSAFSDADVEVQEPKEEEFHCYSLQSTLETDIGNCPTSVHNGLAQEIQGSRGKSFAHFANDLGLEENLRPFWLESVP
ncbi:unnamed protein product [Protopolystoma xenopodis]|uniref:Uncharacterized protein n=1 Tax=Protopolystoma xenopodis TaxID=117903 RepID=A0A3S4ZYH3_9PLAT|nr:unnamed protein product [Protopolystoma xenopodis]